MGFVQGQLAELNKKLTSLDMRHDQLNDVKESIKQTNDLISVALIVDFDAIDKMLTTKLDQMTNQITEKLKGT